MKFYKYHALGNDYLVLNPQDCPDLLDDDAIVRICHRNFGLGSDGILYGPLPTEEADCALKSLILMALKLKKAAMDLEYLLAIYTTTNSFNQTHLKY